MLLLPDSLLAFETHALNCFQLAHLDTTPEDYYFQYLRKEDSI